MFKEKTSRIQYIDILKGIGIILVVIGHIYKNQNIFNWIYSFHMPIFFFAAGWLYKERSVYIDIKRRIQTIVIPYFCFGLLTLLYWQLIERRFRDSEMSFGWSVFGLIFGQYDYLDFNVHLWFLPCFFTIVVFYNVLVKMSGEYGRRIALIVSTIMSSIYIILPIPSLPWGIDRVFKFIGFYAVATVCASFRIDEKIRMIRKPIGFIIAAVLLAINFLLSYNDLDTGLMWLSLIHI